MSAVSDAPLQSLNTLRLSARARLLCTIETEQQLQQALEMATQRSLRPLPLGEGSNVVLAGDVDALVLLQRSRGIELLDETSDTVLLRVAAGENWHNFVRWTLARCYFGLENLALIPGTAGAAPIQNIGAYGVEVSSFVHAVHSVELATGRHHCLAADECEFAYRNSVFKTSLQDRLCVTSIDLKLSRRAQPHTQYPALANWLEGRGIEQASPEQVFDAVVAIRSSKLPDPAREPNAGSFFHNPIVEAEQAQELMTSFPGLPNYPQPDGRVKLAAAWLIEQCGWKARRRRGVGVHDRHALVLVNYGSNSGRELLQLANDITRDVATTFGVDLVIEPRVYGDGYE